jgi:hypothetical protein
MDRTPEPESSGERELLLGWLDFHRDALAAKCAGLDDEQLVCASAPPSALSLLGLVRHLTEMERHYLVDALAGTSVGLLYCTEENPEADIEGIDASMVAASMAAWAEARSRADAALHTFDDLGTPTPSGHRTARWHVLKVLQEYARHNGHADIIRERIDGARGE